MLSKEETSSNIVDELESKCRSLSAELFSKEKEIDLLKVEMLMYNLYITRFRTIP